MPSILLMILFGSVWIFLSYSTVGLTSNIWSFCNTVDRDSEVRIAEYSFCLGLGLLFLERLIAK